MAGPGSREAVARVLVRVCAPLDGTGWRNRLLARSLIQWKNVGSTGLSVSPLTFVLQFRTANLTQLAAMENVGETKLRLIREAIQHNIEGSRGTKAKAS